MSVQCTVGDVVLLTQSRVGIVRYMGHLKHVGGKWIGIEVRKKKTKKFQQQNFFFY